MEQIQLNWGGPPILTVSQLTAAIKELLTGAFGDLAVSGEISGLRLQPSGHAYFTLKDAGSQVKCACFKSALRFMRHKPQEGLGVIARGRLDVYEPRGEYQFIVESLEPQGLGQLMAAFEALKTKLAAEGLFDPSRKKPIPRLPRRIGIVTSPAGAVIRDMLQILGRRFPGLHIRLYPAQVQGAGSVESVVSAIDWLGRSGWPDVIIAGRGGGSLEDLWTFNEEAVARAIARCPVPVISAVGHETDFTIADFAADLRAPTPSAAAELVVPLRAELLAQSGQWTERASRALQLTVSRLSNRLSAAGVDRLHALLLRQLGKAGQRVDELDNTVRERTRARLMAGARQLQHLTHRLRDAAPRTRLSALAFRLDQTAARAEAALRRRVSASRLRLDRLHATLRGLSPLAILERGYAVVSDESGNALRESAQTRLGAELEVRLHRGRLKTRVTTRDAGYSTR